MAKKDYNRTMNNFNARSKDYSSSRASTSSYDNSFGKKESQSGSQSQQREPFSSR